MPRRRKTEGEEPKPGERRTWYCPNEDCDFEEDAGRPPHYNPCPKCRQPVGFLVA